MGPKIRKTLREIANLFQPEDAHEFKPTMVEIEEKPVPPLKKIVFWLVISVFVSSGIWLYVGKVDVVVTSRGMVIPEGEIKTIQPLDTGVISSILCHEGKFVKKGEVLMEIDPSITAPELDSKRKNLQFLELEQLRLNATLGKKSFLPKTGKYDRSSIETQREFYQSAIAGLQKQIEAKKAELRKIEEERKAAEKEKAFAAAVLKINTEKEQRLGKVIDIIAKTEYEKVIQEILTSQNTIEQMEVKQQQLSHQRQQIQEEINYLEENFKTTAFKEYSDKHKQVIEIRAEIEKNTFKNEKQKILAPADGYVTHLFVHTVGGVVTPAQKLITLVPLGAPLIIKSNVQNKDIGFIKEKMPVLIKVDTFDFQKYGMLEGITRNIAKHSIEDEKLGPVYEVYIHPLTRHLMVEGVKTSIGSGMSLTAEIKVGKRRIIEFFIYPLIKYLDEGIKVR
jgi:hemolysin D